MDYVDNRTGVFHTFRNGERREIVIELADEATIEALRGLTPEERLQRAATQARDLRRALHSGLEALHPQWSEERLRQEVIRLYFAE